MRRPSMRYRLRTLLIAATIGPPVLAGAWFLWQAWPVACVLAMLALGLFGLLTLWIVV